MYTEFGNDPFPSLPNGLRILTTGVCRNFEVLVSDVSKEIDLETIQISDFEVILGME